jgi:hypothetical protein|eukprot:COSAG02_NODE_1363_length_13047_cov_5.747374_2_plen_79_part_00
MFEAAMNCHFQEAFVPGLSTLRLCAAVALPPWQQRDIELISWAWSLCQSLRKQSADYSSTDGLLCSLTWLLGRGSHLH